MASIQYKLFSGVLGLLPLKFRLNILNLRRFRRTINFNSPITFNEKLQVRKVFDRNPLLTVAADKIESKKLVKSICGDDIYFPKTIWSGDSIKDIDNINFEDLPKDYVYKANHTSQTIEIIRDGHHLPRSKMKKLAKNWLMHDQSSSLGEWAYKNIPRKIFIEEFLDFEGSAPDDYKFFVYHGTVKFIQLDSDRFTDHRRNMFDRQWNDLEFEYSHRRKIPSPSRPNFLDEMIRLAEVIGQKFDFVRVDFYFYKNKVAFGELTIYPGAGFERFPHYKYDKLFGLPWHQKYED